MTAPVATSLKDVPKFARIYFIGKNENGEVDAALAKYTAKYHKPETYVIYKQYLYIQHEEVK